MALSVTGVTVKIKYKRGETEFVVPFRLSKSMMGLESPWAIAMGGVLEGIVWMGMEWLTGPRKQQEHALVLSAIGKRVRLGRKSARNQQRMMIARANEIIGRENMSIHGLIIIEARYGTRLKHSYPWSSSSIDDLDESGGDFMELDTPLPRGTGRSRVATNLNSTKSSRGKNTSSSASSSS